MIPRIAISIKKGNQNVIAFSWLVKQKKSIKTIKITNKAVTQHTAISQHSPHYHKTILSITSANIIYKNKSNNDIPATLRSYVYKSATRTTNTMA